MIYDIKMEGFSHSVRLVAGGHMTTAPSSVTYVSVVLHKSVHIALVLVALNYLEVKCGDVSNVYITIPAKEKVWAFLGPEHGEDAGKRSIIV